MNCLDYRRLLAAGEAETAEAKTHRAQCAGCSELFAEQGAFETQLRQALEVPVPENFAQRIAAASAQRRRRFFAAAAAAALATAAGAYVFLERDDPLALACIQFVMMEEAKSIMMGAMPRAAAEAALAGTLPLARLEAIGQIRHIGPCPFNGATAYHVVLAIPQGKVTLLVMPEGRAASDARATHEGMVARVLPLASGSVGIIGTDAAVVHSVAGALRA